LDREFDVSTLFSRVQDRRLLFFDLSLFSLPLSPPLPLLTERGLLVVLCIGWFSSRTEHAAFLLHIGFHLLWWGREWDWELLLPPQQFEACVGVIGMASRRQRAARREHGEVGFVLQFGEYPGTDFMVTTCITSLSIPITLPLISHHTCAISTSISHLILHLPSSIRRRPPHSTR
jgi:hypothetical protein